MENHQLANPAKQMKEGCLMIFKGIKDFIKKLKFDGVTLDLRFIGLRFVEVRPKSILN